MKTLTLAVIAAAIVFLSGCVDKEVEKAKAQAVVDAANAQARGVVDAARVEATSQEKLHKMLYDHQEEMKNMELSSQERQQAAKIEADLQSQLREMEDNQHFREKTVPAIFRGVLVVCIAGVIGVLIYYGTMHARYFAEKVVDARLQSKLADNERLEKATYEAEQTKREIARERLLLIREKFEEVPDEHKGSTLVRLVEEGYLTP